MSPTRPSARPALPARLALAAHHDVHVREPDSRQIGLDPARGVVCEGLPPAVAGLLDELGPSGVRTDDLVRRAAVAGAEPGEVRAVLAALVGSGLVRDADRVELVARRRAAGTVEVRGDGPLALGVASGLARAGLGRVHGRATGRVDDRDLAVEGMTPDDLGRDRASVASALIERVAPRTRTGPLGRAAPDLVVLAGARAWPPHETAALVRRAVTHLVIGLRDGRGMVGPLVLPGRSACLGCLDLVRTALDPGWPALAAAQLDRTATADATVVDATVALGVTQALLALDGPVVGDTAPPTLNATVEVDVARCALPVRRWTPHPGCACGAASSGASGRVDAACTASVPRETIRG